MLSDAALLRDTGVIFLYVNTQSAEGRNAVYWESSSGGRRNLVAMVEHIAEHDLKPRRCRGSVVQSSPDHDLSRSSGLAYRFRISRPDGRHYILVCV